ncbi:MAG: hypothetical protein NTV86_17240 [Planctomycetota bacterium]|nr:hypothetical protein [Planctomycetota bacterium]
MTNEHQEPHDQPGPRLFSTNTMIVLGVAGVLIAAAAWMHYAPSARTPAKAPAPASAAGDDAAKVLEDAARLMQPQDNPAAETQNYIEAVRTMQAYVQRHPGDVQVRPAMAQALWQLGQYPLAESTCDDLLKRKVINARVLMLKGICVRQRTGRPALAMFEKALKAPGADAEVQAEYAVEALTAGDEKQKAQVPALLDQVLVGGSLRAERWADFAFRLSRANEPKAYQFFEKGLEAGAKKPAILVRIGFGLLQGGQEAWGRKYLSAARQAGVNAPEFLRVWGQAELQVNNVDRGRELINESLGLKADQRECYDLLARSLTGPDALTQAEAVLARGVAACANPADQDWLQVRLGENRERQQNYRDAAETYARAVRTPEQTLLAAKGAARCYLKLMQIDNAAEWVAKAAAVGAGDAEVKQIKAQIEQARGGVK